MEPVLDLRQEQAHKQEPTSCNGEHRRRAIAHLLPFRHELEVLVGGVRVDLDVERRAAEPATTNKRTTSASCHEPAQQTQHQAAEPAQQTQYQAAEPAQQTQYQAAEPAQQTQYQAAEPAQQTQYQAAEPAQQTQYQAAEPAQQTHEMSLTEHRDRFRQRLPKKKQSNQ